MNGEEVTGLLWGAGALILVVSALAVRRMSIGHLLRTMIAWIGIFAVVFVAFSYRHELGLVWERVKGEITGEGGAEQVIGSDDEVHIRPGLDGHFHAQAKINGQSTRMLVDSGATFTAMGTDRARELGISAAPGSLPRIFTTANGEIRAYPAKIERLQIGTIVRNDVTVFVADEFRGVELLGMNFLSSLSGWRVENNEMILRP